MQRTRVKICGITRVEDALTAAEYGVDALGFVFYSPSPRNVGVEQAARICRVLPPFVSTVALFVDPDASFVSDVLSETRIDTIQFHGNEPAAFCQQFGRPWYKAIRVKDREDIVNAEQHYSDASALLLDSFVENIAGGTGKSFDWSVIPEKRQRPLILAGGLTPGNVAEAIIKTRPWAVDVSGGVEWIERNGQQQKGIKSAAAIKEFMRGVNSV